MTQNTSAIRAYFDEADYGNNHWAAVIVAIPMFAGMMLVDPEVLEGVEPPVSEAPYQTLAGMAFALNALIGNSKLVYGAMLAVFPIIALGVYIAQKGLHKRSLRSLHTAAPKYRWGRMFFSMAVFWVIAAILTFVGHATGNSPAELVFDPSRFFGFALVSLLFIPLQSATEEIILRGYLNQGLSRKWLFFIRNVRLSINIY